jgi:perosamine synthetase
MARIPITRPAIDDAEIEAVAAVLKSGMLVQGEQVLEFERAIASSAGTEFAVALSNCTVALEVALRAVGVQPGDSVVVTPYSWVATVNAIEIVGARPLFVDIDPRSFNLSPEGLAQTLARNKVAAVLPVHTFGNVAGIDAIAQIAATAGVPLVEDAACAIGAKSEGGSAGGIGVAGCFSFHPRKVVTTGEGGAVTTNDPRIADFVRMYRNHGQHNGAFAGIGSNFRMTDFQAAMGRVQMTKLDWMVSERSRLAERYDAALTPLGCRPQHRSIGSVVQSYVALTPAGHTGAEVVDALRGRDIEATVGTIAIPFTPFHSSRYGLTSADLPVVADVNTRAVTLPLFPGMTIEQQDAVIRALTEVLS